jgi:hypothetical protein
MSAKTEIKHLVELGVVDDFAAAARDPSRLPGSGSSAASARTLLRSRDRPCIMIDYEDAALERSFERRVPLRVDVSSGGKE